MAGLVDSFLLAARAFSTLFQGATLRLRLFSFLTNSILADTSGI
jgi:hypothetical protein